MPSPPGAVVTADDQGDKFFTRAAAGLKPWERVLLGQNLPGEKHGLNVFSPTTLNTRSIGPMDKEPKPYEGK